MEVQTTYGDVHELIMQSLIKRSADKEAHEETIGKDYRVC